MTKATITLAICAKYGVDGYQTLVQSAIGYVDEIVTAVDDDAEPGIDGYCPNSVHYRHRPVARDFSAQHNYLISIARCDWIINLDTDENLLPWIWPMLRFLVDSTTEESILLPFRNRVGDSDYLDWPDYHPRIYRRRPSIVWHKRVHQELIGPASRRFLPAEHRYAVQHIKTLEMQARSEAHYATW